MMSIVEQFGKKRNKIEPEIPMPKVVYTPAPHEKHAQSLVYVADLVDDNQKLTIENEKLRSDLRLAVMRIKDLERLDSDRAHDLEAYRRYAVTVETHFDVLEDAVRRIREAGLRASEGETKSPDSRIKEAVDAIEKEVVGAQPLPQKDEAPPSSPAAG